MATTSVRGGEEIPWVSTIVYTMAGGAVAMIVYSWSERSWKALACSVIMAVAAGIAGGLIGFIFGIPKTVTTTTNGTADATHTEYQGNSNLEQISDWLTKILVGAGLVQLGAIRDEFNALGSRFGTHGCMGSCGWIVGPAIIVAYSVCGFLLAYLWARIYMARALEQGNTTTTQSTTVSQ